MATIEEVMLDYNGIVRSVKLRIGISNRADKNQILERPVHKIVLLVEKQVLVDSPTKELDSRWFYDLGGGSCRCQKSKKGTEMECMKYMMENLFWTLKVVCQILQLFLIDLLWSKFKKQGHYLN